MRVVDQVLGVSQPGRTGGKFVAGDLDICVPEVVLEALKPLKWSISTVIGWGGEGGQHTYSRLQR